MSDQKVIMAKTLPKKLLKLDGISGNQIEQHFTLYEGYVKKVNEIREKLTRLTPEELQAANQSFSYLRALKVGETFAMNGVTLHEDYFGNLSGEGTKAEDRVLSVIKKEFGSLESFKNYFAACGMAVRGWVMLVYNQFTKKVEIVGSDVHDFGSIWRATPILVMDVYEHAYMIDYGVKRPPYIEAFMKNIDWGTVASRLEQVVSGK